MIRRSLQIVLVLFVALVGAAAFVYFRAPRPRLVGPITYYEYSSGQERGKDLHIAPDTELYKAIEKWLAQKRRWRPDFNTYAPRREFRSEFTSISILRNGIILGVKPEDGLLSQYSCRTDEETERLAEQVHRAWELNNAALGE